MSNLKALTKTKKTRHLGRKVSILVACLLAVSIIAVVCLCIFIFNRLTTNMLKDQCISGTNILAYQLAQDDGTKDQTELLDDLKEQLGCEFTIFEGNTRACTTIQQDGTRVVGTTLSDELAEIILTQGKSYVGKADILGVEHLCSYVPTTGADGQVNGLIFAGISMADVSEQTNLAIRLSCAAGMCLIVISFILLTIYVRYRISVPLSRLTTLALKMEEGELGLDGNSSLTANVKSNDEIGLLADIFETTTLRLRSYIGEISAVLKAISDGDLDKKTTLDYVGDFSSIKTSLDDILAKLNSTMSQIVESSAYVSNGSEQMSIGAQALSQGAVEQAGAVEELDENIREISGQVTETAENARLANEKVEYVARQLLESNQKMHEMIDAMEEINASSSEIGKILKTIESIAFQTNILALNASVEAARAGTAGKGFAVVAEEVRSLSTKTSEASQSTAELIERSIGAVEYGTKIANETAARLESVVLGANEVTEATNRIADASRTQADAISQIQERISQISDVVQTNSATAEESAATSQELSSQAGLLKKLIGIFRLKSSGSSF